MTKKEVFLQNILANKKIWEDAYEFNSRLPDSFFESLPIGLPEKKPMQIKPGMEKAHAALDTKPASNTLNTPVIKYNNQYVGNKKTVQKIIKEHGQELMKLQIIELYEKITGDTNVFGVVTNALSALQVEGNIIGRKPEGFRGRGNFWSLKEWWEDGNLKNEYKVKQAEKMK